jgi:hypothetical protein
MTKPEEYRARARKCELRADQVLVVRHELTHGRNVRQRVRARRGGYCERAQPDDILDRRDNAGEHDLHLPGEQVGERRCLAAIRHVHYVDAGHHLKQLAENMASTPMPADAMLILPGLALA